MYATTMVAPGGCLWLHDVEGFPASQIDVYTIVIVITEKQVL